MVYPTRDIMTPNGPSRPPRYSIGLPFELWCGIALVAFFACAMFALIVLRVYATQVIAAEPPRAIVHPPNDIAEFVAASIRSVSHAGIPGKVWVSIDCGDGDESTGVLLDLKPFQPPPPPK